MDACQWSPLSREGFLGITVLTSILPLISFNIIPKACPEYIFHVICSPDTKSNNPTTGGETEGDDYSIVYLKEKIRSKVREKNPQHYSLVSLMCSI